MWRIKAASMQMIHQRLVTPVWSTNEASLWGNLASTPVLCRDETPRVSDLGPSAPSSAVANDSLLIAGGLQLPSHFPKGGTQEWNRTWDLVDMEPKCYSMCYRGPSVRACLELAHYLCTLQSSLHAPPRQGLYLTTSRNHTEDFVARGHHVDAKVAGTVRRIEKSTVVFLS